VELWIELVPSTRRERILEKVSLVRDLVDAVFIPEAPLGYPRAHSVAVAHVVKELSGLRAFASVRTRDVNANALLSLLGAAVLLDIDGVVVTRGDPPVFGSAVDDIGTEDAVRLARSDRRVQHLRLGAIVSLAKGYAEISERLLGLSIDFVLVTRLWRPEQLMHSVFSSARRRGVRVVPYLVVSSESERSIVFEMLKGHQKVFTIEEVEEFIECLRDLVDGVIVTAPRSFIDAVRALARIARRA